MLARLADVVDEATASFQAYEYHKALTRAEAFFWQFCDEFIELVKVRAYGEGSARDSALAALSAGLSTFLRLFAPFLPFATEEAWSWWQEGSVHRANWPESDELRKLAADANPAILEMAADVLTEVHRAKAREQRSIRSQVDRVVVTDDAESIDALRAAEADLRAAGRIVELVLDKDSKRLVTVELARAG